MTTMKAPAVSSSACEKSRQLLLERDIMLVLVYMTFVCLFNQGCKDLVRFYFYGIIIIGDRNRLHNNHLTPNDLTFYHAFPISNYFVKDAF